MSLSFNDYVKRKKQGLIKFQDDDDNNHGLSFDEYQNLKDQGKILSEDDEEYESYDGEGKLSFNDFMQFRQKGQIYYEDDSDNNFIITSRTVGNSPQISQQSKQTGQQSNAAPQGAVDVGKLDYGTKTNLDQQLKALDYEKKYKGYSLGNLSRAYVDSDSEEEKTWIENKLQQTATIDEIDKYMNSLYKSGDSDVQRVGDAYVYDGYQQTAKERQSHILSRYNDELSLLGKVKGRITRSKDYDEKNSQYEEKYKNADTATLFQARLNSDDSGEQEWLKNRLESKASSREYKDEIDRLTNEYDTLYDKLDSYDDEKHDATIEYMNKISDIKGAYENEKRGAELREKKESYSSLEKNKDFAEKSYPKEEPVQRGDLDNRKYMTSDEQAKYNYLENTQGKDKAEEYFKVIEPELNKRMTASETQKAADFAEAEPVLASAQSIGYNVISGAGFVEDVGKTLSGQYIDTNSFLNLPSNMRNTERQTVASNIDSDVGKWLYNTGMSAADSAVNIAISKGVGSVAGAFGAGAETVNSIASNATSIIMGSQVATQTVIESKAKGMTDDQAIALGLIHGLVEHVTEKVSVENILSDPRNFRQAIAKSFVSEGSEEVASNWLDRIADSVIEGDKNEELKKYNEYLAQGMSESEALSHVIVECLGEDASSFLAGGVSGVAMSGTSHGMNAVTNAVGTRMENTDAGKKILSSENYEKDIDSLINSGKNLDDKKGKKLAENVEKDLNDGKKLSANDVGKLSRYVAEDELQKVGSRFAEATKDMSDEDALTVASAAGKLASGKSLTTDEVEKLNQSPQLMQAVADTLGADEDATVTAVDTDNVSGSKAVYQVSSSGSTEVNGAAFTGTVEIKSIDPKTGKTTYNLISSDGTTEEADSDSVSFKTEAEAELYRRATAFNNVDEANAFIDSYKPGQDVDEYAREWGVYSNYGRMSVSLTDHNRLGGGYMLTNDQKYAAYEYGLEAYKSAAQQRKIAADALMKDADYGHVKQGSFTVNVSSATKLTREQKQAVTAVKAVTGLGINVEIFESKTDKNGRLQGENGSFDPTTRTLRLDVNAGFSTATGNRNSLNAAMRYGMINTAAHELTHIAKEGGQWDELRGAVVKTLEKGGHDFAKMVESKRESLGRHEKYADLTYDEMTDLSEEETIAEACETMLEDGTLLQELIENHPEQAKGLKAAIQKVINSIRDFFKKHGKYARTAEGKALLDALDKTEADLQSIWNNAVKEGAKAVNVKTESKGEEKEQARYAKQYGKFSNALTTTEWGIFYSSSIKHNQRDSFRIGNNGIVLHGDKFSKVVYYEDIEGDLEVKAVYKITNYDYNIHDNDINIMDTIIRMERNELDEKLTQTILRDYQLLHGALFQKYNPQTGRYVRYPRGSYKNTSNTRKRANGNGTANGTQQNIKNQDRFSDNDIRDSVHRHFGHTYSWNETGYITTDGQRLDFSGRHKGAPGGHRHVDHRDVWDGYPEELQDDLDGSDAMYDFISRGNIRIMPEAGVIHLTVAPTPEQKYRLRDFISRERGEVTLEITDEKGNNLLSVEYPKSTSSSKVLNDIDAYFEKGTKPTVSDLGRFRYQDRDYLSAVERGDMETAQRMVDEAAQAAGYDLHLYHGSKSGGGFTMFKDWQYFTANQAYAERYTQHDTGKGMYDVYVKASRMFDTRNADDRALFEQYRSEYGMSNLQDSGLPDWTDGYDLSEIIEENDLDYDGIILDEGGDIVNGKPVSRGESYVIRNSSQIKSADPVTYDDDEKVIPLSERFKTDNKDIRYQDRTDDFDDFSMLGDEWFDGDLFDEQNQRILDRFIDEQPDLALDTMYRAAAESAEKGIRGTKSVQLTDKSYRLIARRLMRDYDISGKANPEFEGDFIKELKTITSNIENGVYKSVEEMSNDLAQRAHDALLFSGHLDYSGVQDELDFIRGKLSGSTLIIPDSAEANIRENYGSVAKYGQRIGARVGLERNLSKKHLTGAQGVYIEDIIAHTEESYRNLITDEADGDQGYVWLDKLLNDTLQPQFVSNTYDKETFDAASAEMAFAIASEIIAEKASQLAADNRAGKKLRDLGYNAKKLRDEQKQKIAEAKKQAIANERKKGKERLKKQHERDMKRKNEQLKKVREKGEQRLIAERERRQNDLRTLRNNRDKRIYIDRIKRLAGEFQQMALHPNDKSYVIPEYLSSGFYEAAQAITDALRLSDSTKAGAALMKLSNTLGQLAKEEAYMFEFDEDFRSQVDAFARLLDGKKIDRNLTLREAEDIYRLMREIKDTVKDANKVIRENEGRTVKELGQAVIEDQKSIKPAFFNRHLNGVKNYFMTPERMSNIINGFNDNAALVGMMNDIKAGYRKKNRFFMEANKMFDEYRNAHVKELDDTEHNVREIAWTDNAGNKRTAKMTGMQAMQLVMTWNREAADDNLNHMTKGSVAIADPEYLAKGKFGKAYDKAIKVYGLNYSFIGAVQGSLTDFERGYIAIAEKLFNEKSTEAINKTSLKLKHRQIAKSKYYIPISVIGEEVVKDVDGVKFDSSLENMGMLKSITPHSNKSILICGLDNVINKHIANVSDYYGLAIPIRNLNKVLNVSVTQYDDDGTVINRDTVKSVLRENWGDLGEKVYDQILTDLQGGRAAKGEKFQGANKLIRAIRSNFVTSTLNANKSVVLKQAASYATAQVYLDPSALAGGSVDIRHYIGKGKYKALLDEIDSHTAQHYIRRAGLSSNEIADMQNNWLSAFLSNTSAGRKLTTSKLAQALPGAANPNNWIQEMDCLTTATLWCACKQQVNKDYNKAGKEIDTAAYWQNVTDLYDKVIEDTQPMYDPLHRPEVLKTSNEFIKSVFMFKTQPLQNAGIIYESVGRFAQNKDTASGRQLRKAVTSQTRSLLVFSLMSLAVAFAMHNLKRYKDEDDELTAQSVLSTVFGDMGKNGLGLLLPFGGTEFAEIVSGKYDVFKDNIIEQVNTFLKTGNALVNTIGTEFEKAGKGYDINTDNIVTALEEFAIVAGQDIFGVPIKNLKKNINGYIEWAKDIGNGNELFDTEVQEKKEKQIAHSYAKKVESGNTAEAEKLLTDFYNEELNKAKSNSSISNPENKASQNTRDMLVNAYKTEYQKAFLKGDTAEMQRIEKILYSANRYMKWERGSNPVSLNSGNGKQEGKLKQWRQSAREDVSKKMNAD